MNFEQLRDWKNHYRSLISYKNSKLVCIKNWFQQIDEGKDGSTYIFVKREDWEELRDLVERELFRLPNSDILNMDRMVESGLIQLSLLTPTKVDEK